MEQLGLVIYLFSRRYSHITTSFIFVKAVAIESTGELLGLPFPLFQIVPVGGSLLLLCFPETIDSECMYSSLCIAFSLSAISSTFFVFASQAFNNLPSTFAFFGAGIVSSSSSRQIVSLLPELFPSHHKVFEGSYIISYIES